jgi:UDP-N-acetylmuramoyl-tripeptide--D-alanyl-D-alanine ligase
MERGMMDTATAAAVVRGQLRGGNVRFDRVTTDTRALAPGDLFVALKGEQFDGHDFVATAFERGAAAALVAADRADALPGALWGALVAVADPLAALGQLALHWRRQFAVPVIVIAGSNGKTTVKEMVAAILRAEFGADAVHATRGNFNNAIGLPLTLLGLRAQHRAAAVELGMNHSGETAELAAIAQPTVAIVNNAQREHQEFMAGTVAVAEEHAALIRALPAGGTAVLNADDAHVGVWRDAARARQAAVVEFGLDHPATVAGRFVPEAAAGTLLLTTGAGEASVKLTVPGRHNAANALAATAATLAAGVGLAAVVRGLEAFRPVAGRLVTRAARNGAVVIDDTYNANPDSVRAAIGVLAAMPGAKCLVLGDMGEVGAQGPAYHEEIGAYAREQGIDRLLASGVLAAATVAAFGEGALHFSSVELLAQHAEATIDRATTVLVKGSRFMRMERVVAVLTGDATGGGLH